jgi:hypothetical protein
MGPDLSRVGSARSRELMVRRIRGAVEGFGSRSGKLLWRYQLGATLTAWALPL